MSIEAEKFEKEYDTLKRMINEYLSSDPILNVYELEENSLKPQKVGLDTSEEKALFTAQSVQGSRGLCCKRQDGSIHIVYRAHCPVGETSC
jgi:hypothetical protein